MQELDIQDLLAGTSAPRPSLRFKSKPRSHVKGNVVVTAVTSKDLSEDVKEKLLDMENTEEANTATSAILWRSVSSLKEINTRRRFSFRGKREFALHVYTSVT